MRDSLLFSSYRLLCTVHSFFLPSFWFRWLSFIRRVLFFIWSFERMEKKKINQNECHLSLWERSVVALVLDNWLWINGKSFKTRETHKNLLNKFQTIPLICTNIMSLEQKKNIYRKTLSSIKPMPWVFFCRGKRNRCIRRNESYDELMSISLYQK